MCGDLVDILELGAMEGMDFAIIQGSAMFFGCLCEVWGFEG